VRETHKLVIKHIAAVRRIPQLHDCTVVLVLESNLAFEAQHLMHALTANNVRRWVALSEGQGGTVGWLTTNERKEARRPHHRVASVADVRRCACAGHVLPAARRAARRLHRAEQPLLHADHGEA